ncbi:mCG1039070, partial [Mus musculus]
QSHDIWRRECTLLKPRVSLCSPGRLSWNLLYRPSWPQTCRDLPTAAEVVCTTTTQFKYILKRRFL